MELALTLVIDKFVHQSRPPGVRTPFLFAQKLELEEGGLAVGVFDQANDLMPLAGPDFGPASWGQPRIIVQEGNLWFAWGL
jgi:hypothetical protein